MSDLCIGYCPGLRDISFVSQMPELEMAWFPGSSVSAEQQSAAKAARPDTRFLFYPSRISSTSDGWRAAPHNLEIRRAFVNWRSVVEFRAWDDVEYVAGAELSPVIPLDY
jgi:hypothetical protein